LRRDWKAEAVKQWDLDPCGADRDSVFGTAEFFAQVEHERYVVYAPWMKSVMGFDRYAGKRVLEIGFGLGTDHLSFVTNGAICFGVDLTPAHVEATRKRLQLEGQPVRLTRGDAETLPFAAESLDVVYSFGVLHHTAGTKEAISEIHRVLRPGGEAIIGLYHRDSAFYWGSCVLISGLLRGGFVRDGYRKTISRVERREHSDAVPLVKVYSRRSAKHLFKRFSSVQTEVHHFDFDDLGPPGRLAKLLLGKFQGSIGRRFGWYLIIRARK
jgi:SAM-dependent methyltransferase